MSKHAVLDRSGEETVKPYQTQDLSSTSNRTKAEIAADLHMPGDWLGLNQKKQTIPRASPTIVTAAAVANVGFTAFAVTATVGIALGVLELLGYRPPAPPPEENLISQQAEHVRDLGSAPSASQLLEARRQLLAGK